MRILREKEIMVRRLLLDTGWEKWAGDVGLIKKTISPVCGGPWTERGFLRGTGCCCHLRSNSSYKLDMCRAFPTRVLYSLNEKSGYRAAAWQALLLQSLLCTPGIPYSNLLVPEICWRLEEMRSSLSLLVEDQCFPTDLITVLLLHLTLPVPRHSPLD